MMQFEKIGLGTVQFGTDYGISNMSGQVSVDEVSKIIIHCKQNRIKLIDTASAYGNSEETLGKFDLSGFNVVSKFYPNENNVGFDEQLKGTLHNLKLDNIYGYLAHRPEHLLNNPWEWEALQDKKLQGKVKKIGFSLNKPQELHELLRLRMFPDLIQVPYNYLDRRFEKDLYYLKSENVEIHVRSVFLQGLFFINPGTLPEHFSIAIPFLENLKLVPHLAGQLLDFVVSKKFVDHVIVGVDSLTQLKDNLEQILKVHKRDLPDPPVFPESILMPMYWPPKNQ